MTERVACLWSGGLDSTTAIYYFASQHPDWLIQPYHILIRMGSGKDARERDAVDKIWTTLHDRFPNVLPVKRFKYKIRPSGTRNLEMIQLLRDKFGEHKIIVGTHIDPVIHAPREDLDWETLTQSSGVEVLDMRRLGYPTKRDQFLVGVKLLGAEILGGTWSCQLWFKKPCGRCFSCKDRDKLFAEVSVQ